MEVLARVLKVFTPILLALNVCGAVASGIALLILGKWSLLALGIGVLIFGGMGLGMAMLPGLMFAAPATFFERRGNRLMMNLFVFMSVAYTMLVIAAWSTGMFYYFVSRADSWWSFIALMLWSYSVAMGPLMFLATKESDNEYSALAVCFAQIAYACSMAAALVIPVSVVEVFLLFLAVMAVAAFVQFRVAAEQERLSTVAA